MRFAPGERVRVRDLAVPGHMRTPAYVRGRAGSVVRVQGVFRNPETLAYGGDGEPRQPLYLVAFPQRELWPGYRGGAATRSASTSTSTGWRRHDRPSRPRPTTRRRRGRAARGGARPRPGDAPRREGRPPRRGGPRRDRLARLAHAGRRRPPRARAWVDPEFKARLLADAREAAAELGLDTARRRRSSPSRTRTTSTTWSSARSARAIRAPCSARRRPGTRASPTARGRSRSRAPCCASSAPTCRTTSRSRVLDSTADCRYLVIPRRPAGTEASPRRSWPRS